MKFFLWLTGKTWYSTHVVILVDKFLIHYTWGGVIVESLDFLLEPVWIHDIELDEYRVNQAIDNALTLKKVLKKGFLHWWIKATFWLFNRNQYLCTNFVINILGYDTKVGLTPDELYRWLSNV